MFVMSFQYTHHRSSLNPNDKTNNLYGTSLLFFSFFIFVLLPFLPIYQISTLEILAWNTHIFNTVSYCSKSKRGGWSDVDLALPTGRVALERADWPWFLPLPLPTELVWGGGANLGVNPIPLVAPSFGLIGFWPKPDPNRSWLGLDPIGFVT